MENNLLTSLRNYRPRENSDPLENFLTESFAWMLNNYPEFGKFFLTKVIGGLNDFNLEVHKNPEWSTQKTLNNRKRPDMFCVVDGEAFIFEHKAWSSLHPNQLQNYRDAAKKSLSEKCHVILITGRVYLHEQKPDLALCWYNVYQYAENWLNKQSSYTEDALLLLNSFLNLLENEGFGPPAPISHEAIISYHPARVFEENISDFIERVGKGIDWKSLVKEEHYNLTVVSKLGYGRSGIDLLDGWHPTIFVGFMLDGRDHRVEPVIPQSPDCSIILDFDKPHFEIYENHALYKEMIDSLSSRIRSDTDWEFHNHLEHSRKPNEFHPIHIRMPILELFRGTRDNNEEQEKRFEEEVSKVLSIIKECEPFWKLRDVLKAQYANG